MKIYLQDKPVHELLLKTKTKKHSVFSIRFVLVIFFMVGGRMCDIYRITSF